MNIVFIFVAELRCGGVLGLIRAAVASAAATGEIRSLTLFVEAADACG